MRFLIFDHNFGQDIEALRSRSAHQFRVVPYSRFYRIARRHFPEPVFSGLEAYLRPEYEEARRAYAAEATRELHELYAEFPFDAFIAPSDIFFYIRALVDATHDLGLPFIVLQKETTISPFAMIEHARHVGRTFPFIGDRMLVCSEPQKQFWLNAGADPDKITVTGQPRFDVYVQPQQRVSWKDLGLRVPADRPVLLFLSYDVGAYSPEEEMVARTWEELRGQTEEVLMRVASEGRFHVLIKPHPQQREVREDRTRLKRMAGRSWGSGIQLVPAGLDTRHLIANSNVVAGFQTTGLLEAMAAGKNVVYTFWTEPAFRFAGELIPFHTMDGLLRVARSPQELESSLRSDEPGQDDVSARRRAAEEYLGPLDGHATERCIAEIESFCAAHTVEENELRESLARETPRKCARALRGARVRRLFWRVARALTTDGSPLREATAYRHRLAEDEVEQCRALLRAR